MAPRSRRTAGIRARAHALLGWAAYQFGRADAARRHFERVLMIRGADFRAYVVLGRIAFDRGDYAGWRREFEHARRTDPVRFARLQHPLELFEPRLAGTRLDAGNLRRPVHDSIARGERATWGTAESAPPRRPTGDAGPKSGEALAADLGTNADDRELLDHGARPSSSSGEDRAHDDLLPPLPPDASVTRDDFSSASERRRFELRRPIDRREITRCNLNELARRLGG
jgi:hypothetical protein